MFFVSWSHHFVQTQHLNGNDENDRNTTKLIGKDGLPNNVKLWDGNGGILEEMKYNRDSDFIALKSTGWDPIAGNFEIDPKRRR